VKNTFFALGGGRPYKDTTVISFDAERKAAEQAAIEAEKQRQQQAVYATVLNEYLNPAAHDTALLIDALRRAAIYLESL